MDNFTARDNLRHARHARVARCLRSPTFRCQLRAEPHPLEQLAKRGCTLLDWAEWNLKVGDHAKVARVIGVTL